MHNALVTSIGSVPIAYGTPTITPVPFDHEMQPMLAALANDPTPPLSEETLASARTSGPGFPDAETAAAGLSVSVQELVIPGPADAPDLEITVFSPRERGASPLPILVNYHGGGMIVGHRSWEHGRVIDLVARHGVIGVNVEYRLAPEHPFPAGVEDAYAATVWAARHATELGGDPGRLIVMGGSAGGGLAAAVSLMARDRGGPAIAGQLLLCPMLDNTNTTVSSLQYDGIGTWSRDAALLAWKCLLGEELAYSLDAPAYASPSRATDLSGLPPAFIEVGAAEMFRDEDIDYASRIWAIGGSAELHVWSGGCHGFDMYVPESEITRAALAARDSWLSRIFAETRGDEDV
ncbi:alpha/beta hydrolase [Leucobacter insecticola]|uniref:Alpha/beta hydrolase n=1 Tax=Leucobacter insecticola TaxID=2714934 RepID=A0A6G8FIS7_9MICO|nr:alpha/beta hydrolase [Leucobacter insecticola]QIM16238.1 alpha/beta hydrolase [Leucobacter insecticola]